MKLEYLDLALDCLEFKDRYGVIRQSYGCSLVGLDEFNARLGKLHELLKDADEQATLIALYKSNEFFRHCCDRCLELNGITPDWLDFQGELLQGLLFVHEGKPGMLIRLNQPDLNEALAKAETGPDSKPLTASDMAAVLLGLTNDLEKTIESLNKHPAKQITRILQARSEQLAEAHPEAKEKAKRRAWAAQRRKQAKKQPQPFNLEALERVR